MLAMALFDLAGVLSILPFLAVVADPEAIEKHAALRNLRDFVGFETQLEFLQFLGAAVFIVVISGIVVRAVTFYCITRFSREAIQTIATSLLERYLNQPYEWFLTHNSAEVGKSILAEAALVVNQVAAPAIRLIANTLVAVFLLGLLMVLEPIGAIVTAVVLGTVFGLIYWQVRQRLLTVGRERIVAQQERFQVTQEAMSGIKEVKLLRLEHTYAKRFRRPSRRLARHQATIQLIGDMPHFAMEAICFGGMLIFVLWLLYSRGGDIASVLPIIGAFAFAGIKMMPVTQSIFRDIAALRAGMPSLDSLFADLQSMPPLVRDDRTERLSLTGTMELRGIYYRYPGANEDTLQDFNLTIESRSSVGIVGPTGAGKSTVIDIVLGLLRPRSGSVIVDGVTLDEGNLPLWQRTIGYVPQSIYLADDSIAANIAFGLSRKKTDQARIERVARMACLHDFVLTLDQGYETLVGEAGVRLSGGQRQRIGIARALYHEPDLIVFDEATSALDTVTERAVMEALGALQGEKTVIVVTHRLSTVRNCDKVIVLEHGRLTATGTYETLSTQSDRFREMLQAAE